jgi:hypothetical protein
MGYATLLRNGVALTNKLTGKGADDGLQGTFIHEAWISQDGAGKYTFASGVERDGVIDSTPRIHYNEHGDPVIISATITVLEIVPANGAPGRIEPIDPRDRITLADGTTAPIVSAGGPNDPSTGRPYVNQILLGQAPH